MDETVIFLDIETRRTRSNRIRDHLVRNVTPRANLKDPAKIAEDIRAKQSEVVDETPLQPMWGEIAVVCWRPYGFQMPKDERAHYGDDERAVLQAFNEECHDHIHRHFRGRAPKWCGFNVTFDLRFLWTRMLVHGIKPAFSLPHKAPPWSDRIIDLRAELNGSDRYAKGSLQDWVLALGGEPRADDIPGRDVPQALDDGRMDEVVLHCRMDVTDCAWVYRRIYE